MSRRHAEIVGAGLAGLTAAVALAKRGWSVTLHERHSSLRREGFGITIHANGLRVLGALGARDEATRDGVQLGFSELRDASNAVIARTRLDARACRLSRFALVSALAEQARAAGVDIRFGSAAISATPDGTLELANGVAARRTWWSPPTASTRPFANSLGLIRSQTAVAGRRAADDNSAPARDADARGRQHRRSSGGRERAASSSVRAARRRSISRCPAAAMTCRAKQVPIDLDAWTQAFPPLADLLRRVQRDADWSTTLWAPFMLIKLKRWSSGRVAVIGDAAHAMPPNLGQGGSCAMMGALSLAVHLEGAADIPDGLAAVGSAGAPARSSTRRDGRDSTACSPPGLACLSGPALALLALPRFKRQYRRMASHIPTGT